MDEKPRNLRASRLRRAREANDLTLRELAERTGLKHQMIYRYEKGIQEPSSESVRLLARELGVTADYLLGLDFNVDTQLTPQELKILDAYRRKDLTVLLSTAFDMSRDKDESITSVKPSDE